MNQPTEFHAEAFKSYRSAFSLGRTMTGQTPNESTIPERYRWSDDRIRTDLIDQDTRQARAQFLRRLWNWIIHR